jgi:hypothetical protein
VKRVGERALIEKCIDHTHTHTHTHGAWHPYWWVKVASMQAILFCPLGFLLIQALPKNGVMLRPWLWTLSLNGKYSLVLDFGCFWKCDKLCMQIFVWWFAWIFCADYYVYFLTATAGSWWSQWVVMAACPCYIVMNAMKVWHFCEWLSLIRLWMHSCDVVTSQSVCYCGDQYYVYSSTSSPLWWKNDVHLSVISALVLWRMHLLTPSLSDYVASVTAGMAE